MNREKFTKLAIVNSITFSRYAFALLALPFAANGDIFSSVVMLGLAGLTDIADGKLARKWKVTTFLGGLNDAFADGITVGSLNACISLLTGNESDARQSFILGTLIFTTMRLFIDMSMPLD